MIDSKEKLSKKLKSLRAAQEKYSKYDQEAVDKIFAFAAKEINKERIRLAQLAYEETGMGVMEDKVIKNHYASEFIYNAYRNEKTCGIIEDNVAKGIIKIAEPVGVIAALIPVTNPTSTAIFKTLISLKTRNAILICPHPKAKKCTIEAARLVYEAALRAGAPEDIIAFVDEPSFELSDYAMKECDIILATGGQNMVRAAYSSGKPALGVGSGNTPAIIDLGADISFAVNSVIHSKTFDNGVICASEQSVIVMDDIYGLVKDEFIKRGCYFIENDEMDRVRQTIMQNGKLNPAIVGKSAYEIARLCNVNAEKNVKILIGEVESTDKTEAFANEKLSPILAMYRAKNTNDAIKIAEDLIASGGYGHTASLFAKEGSNIVNEFQSRIKACRILLNQPAAQGAIGDIYNFNLTPSLTLGCGSWGGNSVCENIGVRHLLNIKTVAKRRENMLWFRVPKKMFIKRNCLETAIETVDKKRFFIVTDKFLYKNGNLDPLKRKIDDMGREYTVFYNVEPDPTLKSALEGAKAMENYAPDCIIAFGGGSAMDAAKVMWLLYEHPDADFKDMAMTFADIRKRIYKFPKLGEKAYFIAVPTTAGTGSEVTPFAVITDDSGTKYPLADYELMPDMAIIDPELTKDAPRELTAASGIDALTHAIEGYASMVATDYSDAMNIGAIKLIFEYLPRVYQRGDDMYARERMANAATMAGIGFANAFLGICHSMAHKLGSYFHLPHGVANALLIEEVMRFNASETPAKMGTFSQYTHPHTLKRYVDIADSLNIGGCSDEDKFEKLLNVISNLKEQIGIKPNLKEYGIERDVYLSKLDKMSLQAFDDQCTGANPRYPLVEEIKQIYLNIYE